MDWWFLHRASLYWAVSQLNSQWSSWNEWVFINNFHLGVSKVDHHWQLFCLVIIYLDLHKWLWFKTSCINAQNVIVVLRHYFILFRLTYLFKMLPDRGGGGYYGNSGGGGGSRSSGLRGAYWWNHPTLPIHPGVCLTSLEATFTQLTFLSRKADVKSLVFVTAVLVTEGSQYNFT